MSNYKRMTMGQMMMENRTIFLNGAIDEQSGADVVMRLLYLESQKPGIQISLYINSPGGNVNQTLAIVDCMRHISSPVSTICIGKAMSGGAVILAAGQKGKRYCLPHSEVMIHQPLGGCGGQASDIQIQVDNISKTKHTLNLLLADLCSKELKVIEKDTDRDFFLDAKEAVAYGIVDKVVEPKKKKEVKK